MALVKFNYNDQVWGIVRNQKCASTSILSFVAQALWHADPNEVQAYNTFKVHAPGVYHKQPYFDDYKHLLDECDVRVAVWRDPVDKFVSGFYHTMFAPSRAQDSLWLSEQHTLDEFLKHFDHYMKSDTVREHCETNTARLGCDRAYYTHVFNYKNCDQIAHMLGATAVNQRQTPSKPALTKIQQTFVKYIMQSDYTNGWC